MCVAKPKMDGDQWKLVLVQELELYRSSQILKYENVNNYAVQDFQLLYNQLVETLFKSSGDVEPEPEDAAVDDTEDDAGLKLSNSAIVEAVCISFLREGKYDSRCRVLLEKFAERLGIPRSDIDTVELKVLELIVIEQQQQQNNHEGSNINANDESASKSNSSVILSEPDSSSEHIKKRTLLRKAKRFGYIGMAAVGGGLVIGLTGGLAAPLVGAGLASVLSAIGIGGTATFLGSLSGIAIITSLFGAAGAGMTSYRMAYRTRGVKEFFFISHATLISKEEEEAAKLAGDVSPSIMDKVMFWKKKPSTPPCSPVPENEVATHESGSTVNDKPEDTVETKSAVDEEKSADPVETDAVEFFKSLRKDFDNSSTIKAQHCKVVISVSGWVNSYSDIINPWRELFQESDHYSVCWETSELMGVTSALDKILKIETLSALSTQALANTFMAGLMSAMAWPALLLKGASVIDNAWSVAFDRACKAGCVLADVLSAHTQGHRPVTLVGSGLGALVVYHCLLELASKCEEKPANSDSNQGSMFGIVHNVYIFGAPIVATELEWQRARSMVAGRFVNVYSSSDWLLGFVMRVTGSLSGIAGLGGAVPDNIESIDCTDIVGGHASYSDPETVEQILRKINAPPANDPPADQRSDVCE